MTDAEVWLNGSDVDDDADPRADVRSSEVRGADAGGDPAPLEVEASREVAGEVVPAIPTTGGLHSGAAAAAPGSGRARPKASPWLQRLRRIAPAGGDKDTEFTEVTESVEVTEEAGVMKEAGMAEKPEPEVLRAEVVSSSGGAALVLGASGGGLESVSQLVPALVASAGEKASRRFLEFFFAEIRNPNTRKAYAIAINRFCLWCEERQLVLEKLEPLVIAAYIEQLGTELSPPSVKQHLAAIRMLFDYLVVGQVVTFNPAAAVRGPRYRVDVGKTPHLSVDEMRQLFESIDPGDIVGLRDRALIAVMLYSFARVGAVIKLQVKDYYSQGRKAWFHLHEKGGKWHKVPAHHKAIEYLDAYVEAAGIGKEPNTPLFRRFDVKHQVLTDKRLTAQAVWCMVKRRARRAGLPPEICNHSFRATGITAFLQNGGELTTAQRIAGHAEPRTTKLYDRTQQDISLDEIERIVI